jgi:hypothetical protein
MIDRLIRTSLAREFATLLAAMFACESSYLSHTATRATLPNATHRRKFHDMEKPYFEISILWKNFFQKFHAM